MRIMLISRNAQLRSRLRTAFASEGTAVRIVDRQSLWSNAGPDDVMLLHANATESAARWCRVARRAKHVGPLIACCDVIHSEGVPAVFDAGADDVVPSTVETEELLARVRAVCRRVPGNQQEPNRVGAISVDSTRRAAAVCGTAVNLRLSEFRLLSYLVANQHRVVGATELMRDVLGNNKTDDTTLVRVHLSQLRRKLGIAGQAIETVRGEGYRLADRPDQTPGNA